MAALVVGFTGCGPSATEKAITEIQKSGGTVLMIDQSPGKPAISVTFNFPNVMDAGLVHLKGLTQLQMLTLGDAKVTDAGVSVLKNTLPNIKIDH